MKPHLLSSELMNFIKSHKTQSTEFHGAMPAHKNYTQIENSKSQ